MKILITGSHGFIGSALVSHLEKAQHEVIRLVRKKPGKNEISWNPQNKEIDPLQLEGFDAAIHLAGEGIADGRWTKQKKMRIKESRLSGTGLLCDVFTKLSHPPRVWVSASAVGIYGDRGDNLLNEKSSKGNLFVSDVCHVWEEATTPAKEKGIRVANVRIGVVLSPKGGALAKMLMPFKLGLGGIIGDGSQYMSWISLEDIVRAFEHVINTKDIEGPINFVAPNPVTNRVFTKTLGNVLGRPTIFPMPAFIANLAFGEMAKELLLASTRVEPTALLNSGFQFKQSHLKEALERYLP